MPASIPLTAAAPAMPAAPLASACCMACPITEWATGPGGIAAEARPRSFRHPLHNLCAILGLCTWLRSGAPPSPRTIRQYFAGLIRRARLL
jgi:hypothetical protein